ncbi:unnamed protein product, partial [Polarella glacialis]
MRVVICQTAKLTYVQAIELLQRESDLKEVDLILFPENAMEHPPQISEQGVLNMDNVALMLLSRAASSRQIYIVLGSVQEKVEGVGVYNTAIVFNRSGEIILKYRKLSADLGTEPGSSVGVFQTEFGPVAILMGCEAIEAHRWAAVNALSPVLVLNPVNAPMQLDPTLAKVHPELQVAAWHQGFRRVQQFVESQTREHSCVFVRADAPLHLGGAGTSMLVEGHRSVMAPCWSAAFLTVEPTPATELLSRRPPGWRVLSVDEVIEAASKGDRQLLMYDEVAMGPRYLLWTLQTPTKTSKAMHRDSDWSAIWEKQQAKAEEELEQSKSPSDARRSSLLAALAPNIHALVSSLEDMPETGMGREASCFLLPIKLSDGRLVYAVAEKIGVLALWDIRQKRPYAVLDLMPVGQAGGITASRFKQSGSSAQAQSELVVTAIGPGKMASHFLIAATTPTGFSIYGFDGHNSAESLAINLLDLPWDSWRTFSAVVEDDEEDNFDEDAVSRGGSSHESRAPTPVQVRAIYHVDGDTVLVVLEAEGLARPAQAFLIDLKRGDMEPLDIYAHGPPPISAWAADAEDATEAWTTEPDRQQNISMDGMGQSISDSLGRAT